MPKFIACTVTGTLALMLIGCAGTTVVPTTPLHSILFIGNSLTYVNDLPRTLADLALSSGDTLRVKSVAAPDLALIDHINGATNAIDVIRGSKWDVVVLQQGPSSLRVSRDTLILAARLLEPHIRKAGARPALYMVWPSADRIMFFPDVHQAYKLAADSVNGLFLPVGDAWQAAWVMDADLALYGPDGFHPSPLATYLAALVMYEVFTGKDARELPVVARVNGTAVDAPVATIRLLQEAAHRANALSDQF
jgi:hypothetical protein